MSKEKLKPMPAGATSYDESAIVQTKAARRAAVADAVKHFQRAQAANDNIGNCRIVRLNELRATGAAFNTACGREQLVFTADGSAFARTEILPLLPADMDLRAVQACVHIAAKLKAPVQTVEQVNAVERELQAEFELLGLVPSHKRRELQNPVARNWFNEFVSVTSAWLEKTKKLTEAEPMEGWPAEKLDEFLTEAKPMKDQIEHAERIRLGTVRR